VGHFLGINHEMQLEELGWTVLPTLMHLTWAAQWMLYAQKLHEKLREPAEVVQVLDGTQVGSFSHLEVSRHAIGQLQDCVECIGRRLRSGWRQGAPVTGDLLVSVLFCVNQPRYRTCVAHKNEPHQAACQSR
jgi:hypothetical protein